MRKTKSSRDESEKKGKVTSIRLTEEQRTRIHEQAKSKGMTVSNYIVTAAVNGDNAVTPETLIKMQNIANMACAAVEKYAPEKVESIQKGVDELWQELA